ncbi:MAG: DUF1598 domain-containing protein [Planctomycetes bacterium]|nr:DUF1598 domain-containing protein [Planctomycetota bacterium]
MKSERMSRGLLAIVVLAATCISAAFSGDDEAVERRIVEHLDAGEFPAAHALAQQLGPNMRDIAMLRMARAQRNSGANLGWANTVNGMAGNGFGSGLGAVPQLFAGQANGFAGQSPDFGTPAPLAGGASAADFTSLMDLIKKTTGTPKPGWVDDGGVGTVEQFPAGVFVDAAGELRRTTFVDQGSRNSRNLMRATSGNRDVRNYSELRKVSLPRLERELRLRRLLGQPADDIMRNLAGLTRIKYLLVYPDSQDIVIAGPASEWLPDSEGRLVGAHDQRPTLQLDDLIVLLRNACVQEGAFGCSIEPREENLAQLQSFLANSSGSLKPGQRDAWVEKLRSLAGTQDIRIFGIDPRTRVAHLIVEADYRMKLVGMGLEDGTLGVKSYLASLELDKNGKLPPMDVLRWWFTLNLDSIKVSSEHDVFELQGKTVKVLSENQLLSEQGKRQATGKSEENNAQFAASFTAHYDAMARKYPVYADLQNVFDMAAVAALIHSQDLQSQANWQFSYLLNGESCPVALGPAPTVVDSIVNHRVIGGTQVVAGVSGGVSVNARKAVDSAKMKVDTYDVLKAERNGNLPRNLHENAWWWD